MITRLQPTGRILLPLLAGLLVLGAGMSVADAADNATFPASLRRVTTASSSPDADGFIPRWLILEPIPVSGLTEGAVQALVKKEHFPGQLTAVPRDGERAATGDGERSWHALDTTGYNLNLFHFARALGKPTSNVLFWGVTLVDCPSEIRNVRLAIGSNAASVWWVNGAEVIGIYGDRQTVVDDGVSKRLTLRKGLNVIRCAVVNGGGATDFCARFLDEHDEPLKDFSIRLDAGNH